MSTPERVLAVCTANVCRSPVAERLLADALGSRIEVSSAGVRAQEGAAACLDATAWLGSQYGAGDRSRHAYRPPEHRARPLTREQIEAAALVLTATRAHRAAVIRLAPQAQTYTFTLAQAARIAGWQRAQGLTPDHGADAAARLAWLVETLAAGRAGAPRPNEESDDDLADPHEGETTHAELLPAIENAVLALAALLSPL